MEPEDFPSLGNLIFYKWNFFTNSNWCMKKTFAIQVILLELYLIKCPLGFALIMYEVLISHQDAIDNICYEIIHWIGSNDLRVLEMDGIERSSLGQTHPFS